MVLVCFASRYTNDYVYDFFEKLMCIHIGVDSDVVSLTIIGNARTLA